MEKLELKIPPVFVLFIFGVSMWLVSILLPSMAMVNEFRQIMSVVLMLIGAVFINAGIFSFRNAKTTTNPMTPDAASNLVTSGIYQHTRNPMYVGFLLSLLGWGVFLSNGGSLILCVGFVAYMTRFQIMPEERSLTSIFGEEFLTYKKRVRRWL